jgi:pimeloyl-ACP methyl ester carboxylesterase
MKTETKTDTLRVPGVHLYYEVRGSGPVLLMIPGGPTDATAFADIATLLGDRYTIVTYDPRGLSRSRLDGPSEDQRMVEILADDAHRLLAAIRSEPAFVLGNSGGALVGLELAARHPEQVHTLVAHEPPALGLLPDGARHRAAMQEVYDTYRSVGVGPAMQKFVAAAGLDGGPEPGASGPQSEPTPEMREAMARMQGNMEFFLAHMLRALSDHDPDIAALKAASTRIVAAVGEASGGQVAHEAGVALAERLGTKAVVFPGGHGGFSSHPVEFAERLHKVLGDG